MPMAEISLKISPQFGVQVSVGTDLACVRLYSRHCRSTAVSSEDCVKGFIFVDWIIFALVSKF